MEAIVKLIDAIDRASFTPTTPGPSISSPVYPREEVIEAVTIPPAPENDWGPQRDSLYIVVPVTVLYIIIFITGVVGNISTCIVISRNKSMHTATNYYLFSLAISDLLLLISGLPADMYAIWFKYPYVFGEVFCVLQGFAAETSANATVLTITAFTVERYVAICHPFLSHTMSKLSRAVKYIVAVWIVAMMLAVPQAMSFEIFHGSREEQCVCTVTRTVIPHAFGISTLLFFVTPMSLITILYILIGLQLHKSTVRPSRGNSVRLKHRTVACASTATQPTPAPNANEVNIGNGGGAHGNGVGRLKNHRGGSARAAGRREEDGRKNFARNAQGTKHVVKMLVAVVVAFFICWAPFHAQRLFAVYSVNNDRSENMVSAYRILNYISGILYFLSTSINPFLYHIMSHKFRVAFKDTFKGCLCRARRAKGSRCYSTLSGRSSQLNSHSHSNTDSCSRQSSLRYLEAEMARLHDSKRPLVVSFKRKASTCAKKPKQATALDADLQEALDNLGGEAVRGDLFAKVRARSVSERSDADRDLSYVEVHRLEPTHICPVSGNRCGARGRTRHERSERLRRSRRGDGPAVKCKVTWHLEMTKSSTMPQIVNECNALAAAAAIDGRTVAALSGNFLGAACRQRDERSNSCSRLEFRSTHAPEMHEMQRNIAHESITIPVT